MINLILWIVKYVHESIKFWYTYKWSKEWCRTYAWCQLWLVERKKIGRKVHFRLKWIAVKSLKILLKIRLTESKVRSTEWPTSVSWQPKVLQVHKSKRSRIILKGTLNWILITYFSQTFILLKCYILSLLFTLKKSKPNKFS